MNCNSREEFYRFLRADYEENRQESVIYRYLRNKKNKKADELYKNNKELFCEIVKTGFDSNNCDIRDLINNKTAGQYQADIPGAKTRKWDQYSILYCCYEAFKDSGTIRDSLTDNIRNIMRSIPNRNGISKSSALYQENVHLNTTSLCEIKDLMLEQFIHASASDFFYDALKARRSDDVLDIYFSCIAGKGSTSEQDGCCLDNPEYMAEVEELMRYYRQIKEKKNDRELFIPIAIDSDSGAGLYLISDEYLKYGINNCPGEGNYCVVTFDYIDDYQYFDYDKKYIICLGYHIKYRTGSILEAKEKYKETVMNTNGAKVGGYRGINTEYPCRELGAGKTEACGRLERFFEEPYTANKTVDYNVIVSKSLNEGLRLYANNAKDKDRKRNM